MTKEKGAEDRLKRELGDLNRRFAESELRVKWYSRAERDAAGRCSRLKRLAELGLILTGDPVDVIRHISLLIGELLAVPVVVLSEVRGDELFFLGTYDERGVIIAGGSCGLQNTPCATVRDSRELRVYHDVATKFPEAPFLRQFNAFSYCGLPAFDSAGKVIAVVCALDGEPHDFSEEDRDLLGILAQRVGLEIERWKNLDERRRMEEALAAEKEHLAVTLRSIGDGVITTDMTGRIVLMNAVAETLTGWSQDEAAGKLLSEVFLAYDDRTLRRCEDPVQKVIRTDAAVPLCNRTRLITRNGAERTIASNGAPIRDRQGAMIGVVLVFRDMTETNRMETELLRMAKLESLGVLAGGIAHDFNNILAGIMGFLSLGRLYSRQDKKVHEVLGKAEKAAVRAKNLTSQLLTFSNGSWPIKKSTSISDLIAESSQFALSGSAVKCDFNRAPDLWNVEVDEGQFTQAIHNLVINAKESMPEGGILTISAQNIAITDPGDMPLSPGHHVKITVADSGSGIRQEHLPMIFDPYFTTKTTGNGLGLATVYSIISKHGGHIAVRSNAGVGTVFDIFLPASTHRVVPEEKAVEPGTGHGRILVTDDDEVVRTAIGEMAQALGYAVDSASDGTEALRLYERAGSEGRPFDAVIMDLTVPGGMGGKDAIGKFLAMDPSARVVLSSGYLEGPLVSCYREYGFTGIIAKPYSIDELGRVLDGIIKNGKGRPQAHAGQ